VKVAVITDEIAQELAVALELVARHGFEGVEIRSVWNRTPDELDAPLCARIREATEAAGVEIVAFDSPAMKTAFPARPVALARARASLARAVEQASLLGARFVRIFSFYRDGEPDPTAAGACLRSILERVDLGDVQLLLETGTRTNTPTSSDTDVCMRELDGLAVRVLWDPGNSIFSGLEPEPFPRGYELLRDRIAHVHVKDPAGTAHYTCLGDGDVPWEAVVGALATDGFEGYLSLETHWRLGEPLSRELRDDPWGDRFSVGALEASDVCMPILARLVAGAGVRA
jgi:sugar phosphate isomerase/epimerase